MAPPNIITTLNSYNLSMELSNFSIMTLCVCGIVTLSVYFAEYFIRKPCRTTSQSIIHLPDVFSNSITSEEPLEVKNTNSITRKGDSYLSFIMYNTMYFLLVFAMVVVLQRFPMVLLGIQHLAVLMVVMLSFLQFARPTKAVPLSIIYIMIWLYSVNTSYRWILNNTIVVMCILLTGYIQFKNFIYLQIFMWVAFVYDVYMLGGINISPTFQFFSFREQVAVFESVSLQSAETCTNMLCQIFNHDHSFKVPTAFSIQLGSEMDHVFIGTGDIMIGAFVANFALTFFKNSKYMIFTVMSFGVAVSLLSHVTSTPFPALLSIVPICTVAIMILAVFSNRSLELILDSSDSAVPKHRVIRRSSGPLNA